MLSLLIIVPILSIIYLSVFEVNNRKIKTVALGSTLFNLIFSLYLFIIFDNSNYNYQFIEEILKDMNFYIGLDSISLYFIVLTTTIMPLVVLSNWISIKYNIISYMILILLLEVLLLLVFVVLDIFLFYVFFESTLIPLFLLIGIYGSHKRVRASFYLFLYTLGGSLFLLLSILSILIILGISDFSVIFKSNLNIKSQLGLFIGIFIAFAIKTPVIFLNNWLLKAHVESPLGGSIILAAIVLKLSLYGVFRLILPVIPVASINYTYIVYMIGIISIIYASISTLRTIDIKELIAYSSVSHAAVYLLAAFSNNIQGLEGSILLAIAHGFASSGLFVCVGGILYDRTHTRLISFFKGLTQLMPIFSICFFLLCLSNSGTPLTLNFIGEFLSLYGVFERLPLFGLYASSSIIFSAAYSIYMYNRISFGGNYTRYFSLNIIDLTKREFIILFILIFFILILGVYPKILIDGLNYNISQLIYNV